jgi:hypothetical protein
MSFGLLKHFKDHKKNHLDQNQTVFKSNVVMGNDLGSILKLIELRKVASPETIAFITSRPMNKQLLLENYQFGVSHMRSQEAVTEIFKSHFDAKIISQKNETQFYKDGKFHDFGSRAKSMELLAGEDFFLNKGHRLEISSLFTPEDWENLDAIISEHIDVRLIEGIEKTEVSDLVEKAEWLLTFKDFKRMSCENLFVSLSPKRFLSYLKNKESIMPDVIDFCSSTTIQGALSISWVLSKEVHNDQRTILVPQSMTHEWGHFIIEFEDFDYQSKTQMCHGLVLIREEEPQPEDLAGKIKLMKRVLDRVFPHFEDSIDKEYIRFDEEMFISDVKDNLQEQIGFDYPTLKFLGQMAPMKPQFSSEKFMARILLS